MNNNFEEYVKLNIRTYDILKSDSDILDKIENNIKCTAYDENGDVISGIWLATTVKKATRLEVDIEEILNVLGYNIESYDSIIIKGKSNRL